jgi:RNA polymerase sigma factor (sigma-70 family)
MQAAVRPTALGPAGQAPDRPAAGPSFEARVRALSLPPVAEPHGVDARGHAGAEADAVLQRDCLLLEAWRQGDAAAGMQLLDHYAGYVRRTISRQGLHSAADIEEFWQELVLRLMQQLPDLAERVRSSFAGYLAWQVRDLMRSWRRQRRGDSTAMPFAEGHADDDASARLAFWESLHLCAAKLPQREREVFEHRFLHGLALGEVAERVASNANAVAQAVFRLIRRLRTCLSERGFEGPGDLS